MDVPAQVLGAAAVAGHMDEPEPEPVRGPVSHHRPAHHHASVSHRRQVERALASELTATTARRSLLLSVRAPLTPNRSDASATNCGTPQRGLRWRPGADKRDGALPCWTGGQFGFQDPVRGRRRGCCCAHLGGSETSSLVRASTKHASIVGCTRYSNQRHVLEHSGTLKLDSTVLHSTAPIDRSPCVVFRHSGESHATSQTGIATRWIGETAGGVSGQPVWRNRAKPTTTQRAGRWDGHGWLIPAEEGDGG